MVLGPEESCFFAGRIAQPTARLQDLTAWKAVDSQQEADTENNPRESLTVEEGEQPFTFWESSSRNIARFTTPVEEG